MGMCCFLFLRRCAEEMEDASFFVFFLARSLSSLCYATFVHNTECFVSLNAVYVNLYLVI